MTENRRTASFGFREVPEDKKASLVAEVFSSVAGRYDLMNDLMSAGIHRLWKATTVDRIKPRAGMTVLDVAGGTGDIAFALAAKGAAVTVCDINPDMLAEGQRRAARKGQRGISWVRGDAEALPFAAASFDAYTIAFGIRNVTHIEAALAEAHRVLKPGGRFFCLEFSHLTDPDLQKLYDRYSFAVLPKIGYVVAGDAASYRYLVESIRRFPDQRRFAEMISAAGFSKVSYANLTCGIAALHTGWRL